MFWEGIDHHEQAPELKEVGWTAQELVWEGITVEHMKDAGFDGLLDVRAMRDSGLTADDLVKGGFKSARVLKDAGFMPTELKDAEFTAKQLKDAGFTLNDLKDADFTVKQLKDADFTTQQLKDAGFMAKELKDNGFTAKQLKDAGVSLNELRDADFTANQLKDADFTAQQLKDADFTLQQLSEAHFSAGELKDLFTKAQLDNAGIVERKTRRISAPPIDHRSVDETMLREQDIREYAEML